MPAVCDGLIPIPSSVIIADVAAGTLNSSAANFKTAVNGVDSGTESLQKNFFFINHVWRWLHADYTYTLNGSFASLVSVILNVTLEVK